jgi:superfamily I DNA and/or RNA helicase
VALSRAKRLLIIIGNKTLFSSKEIYRNLFEEIEANPSNKFINQDEL